LQAVLAHAAQQGIKRPILFLTKDSSESQGATAMIGKPTFEIVAGAKALSD